MQSGRNQRLSIESSLETRLKANQHPVRGLKRIIADPLVQIDERLMAPLTIADLTQELDNTEDCV